MYKVLEGTETNVTFPNPSGTNPPSTGVLVVVRGPNVRAQIALPKVLAAGTAMETNTVNASGPGLWLGLFGHSEGAHDHTPGGGATQLVERIGVTHTGASIQALEVLAGQTPAHVASLSGSVGSVGFGVFFGPSAWSIGFIGLR